MEYIENKELEEKEVKGIFTDILKYAPSKLCGMLGNVITVPIYTSLFTTEQYGLYTISIAMLSFLCIIFSDWVGLSGLRFFRHHQLMDDLPKYLTTLVAILTMNMALMFAISFIFKDNLYILKPLINPKEIFLGLVFAGLLISITSIYNAFIFNLGITSNLNQVTVEEVALNSPFFSFIILGIIGPICEELTYRVGLFGIIRKYNRLASYIASSVIFGLLHFSLVDFTLSSFINELLNLPSYIISGLILTIAYEKGGFTSCIVAHMFNNILSMYYILFLG